MDEPAVAERLRTVFSSEELGAQSLAEGALSVIEQSLRLTGTYSTVLCWSQG